jgi:hypothetical protein
MTAVKFHKPSSPARLRRRDFDRSRRGCAIQLPIYILAAVLLEIDWILVLIKFVKGLIGLSWLFWPAHRAVPARPASGVSSQRGVKLVAPSLLLRVADAAQLILTPVGHQTVPTRTRDLIARRSFIAGTPRPSPRCRSRSPGPDPVRCGPRARRPAVQAGRHVRALYGPAPRWCGRTSARSGARPVGDADEQDHGGGGRFVERLRDAALGA